jgi:hypothetical protein
VATLYAETNLLIGLARGQDVNAPGILTLPHPHRLVLPAACVMEAMAAFQRVRSDHNRFRNDELGRWSRELGRDRTSPAAAGMLQHIEAARLAADQLIRDVRDRLTAALTAIASGADLIAIDPAVLANSASVDHLDQMTDNLILHTILADAPGRSGPKALLTANVNDFGTPDVVQLLRAVGVDGPFATAADALRWLAAA